MCEISNCTRFYRHFASILSAWYMPVCVLWVVAVNMGVVPSWALWLVVWIWRYWFAFVYRLWMQHAAHYAAGGDWLAAIWWSTDPELMTNQNKRREGVSCVVRACMSHVPIICACVQIMHRSNPHLISKYRPRFLFFLPQLKFPIAIPAILLLWKGKG